jgi:hypothetical protein
MRRYIYIILGVLVVVIIGLIVFWFFFKNQSSPAPSGTSGSLPQTGTQSGNGSGNGNGAGSQTGGSLGNGTPNAAPGTKFGIASNELIFDYFVDAQNNVIAIEPDGKIGQITNSQANYLSSSGVQNLITTGFSYDGKKLFVNFGDPLNPQTAIFDVQSKSWTPLSQGLISPAWSPINYQIAYMSGAATGTKTISTLDVSNPKAKPIQLAQINVQGPSLAWLNKTQLLLFDKPAAFVAGSLWLFDTQKNNLSPVITEELGLQSVWSAATTTTSLATPIGLAFSAGPGSLGGHLQLVDSSGNPLKNVGFVTLTSKCLFNPVIGYVSSTTPTTASTTAPAAPKLSSYLALYCAVPRNQDGLTTARLPDDYQQMALFTSDDFYRVNVVTGETDSIFANPNQNLDASDLKIFNNTLFFVNRYDQKLYAISLSQ